MSYRGSIWTKIKFALQHAGNGLAFELLNTFLANGIDIKTLETKAKIKRLIWLTHAMECTVWPTDTFCVPSTNVHFFCNPILFAICAQ
jgi:hypothetical protein